MSSRIDEREDDADDAGTNAVFIEGISAPLRAAERLPDDFEVRVMAAAHAHVRVRALPVASARIGWWRRPRGFSLSPLAGMALAASLLGAVALIDVGTRAALHRVSRDPAGVATVAAIPARRDTVHVVRFIFIAPHARSIALVGDFNQWSKRATSFTRSPNGNAWVISVALPAGRHEYAFVVKDESGEHWVADPTAPRLSDEFGTESSLVEVASASVAGVNAN
jgi:hypothetical protein